MNIYEVVRRPIVTEKGLTKKESENTLCFEVNSDANKIHIKAAVEKLFKVKVADVRVLNLADGGAPAEVLTSAKLSDLYQTNVEVLHASGRIIIVGVPDGPHTEPGGSQYHHFNDDRGILSCTSGTTCRERSCRSPRTRGIGRGG